MGASNDHANDNHNDNGHNIDNDDVNNNNDDDYFAYDDAWYDDYIAKHNAKYGKSN